MAIKIPVASTTQVRQQGLANVRQSGGRSAAEFLPIGQQAAVAQAGQALGRVEQAALGLMRQNDLAEQQARYDADRLRVQEAATQLLQYDQDAAFSQNGWRQVTGAAAFSRASNQPLTDEVLTARQQRLDELLQGLGNDWQRAELTTWAAQSGVKLRGQLLGHEAEQHRVYKRGVLTSGIDAQMRDMSLYYNDSERLNGAIAAIDQYSRDLGELEHGSTEIGALNGQERIAKALNKAIEASLNQADHASATRILQQFSPHMDPDSLLKAYKLITDERDLRTAVSTANAVISETYPLLNTGDGDRAFNILLQAESGNRHFDEDGNVLLSTKGATGIAQVMPETGPEAAKLAGLPWDEQRFKTDAEYNKALGKAYFKKQLEDFNGNLALAYAAYNAGPGATRKAVADGGIDWLAQLKKETQDYVAKNLAAFGAGQGQAQRPTLQAVKQAALEKLGPDAGGTLREHTLDLVEKSYKEQTEAIKQRDEAATGEAMRLLLETGGQWSELPATVRGQVPVEAVTKVLEFAKKVREKAPIVTDDALFYQLKTDAQLLRSSNLMAFRDRLSDTDFKRLTTDQQKLLAANDGKAFSGTSVVGPKAILDQFMKEAGIDPAPAKDDKTAQAKVGRLISTFEQRISDAEESHGRKLNNQELRSLAAQMFTELTIERPYWFDTTKPAALVDPDEFSRLVVPDEERDKIIAAYKLKRPKQTISEEEIRWLYARQNGLL